MGNTLEIDKLIIGSERICVIPDIFPNRKRRSTLKIQRIILRRFKSIREVVLPENNDCQVLDNLIILIGKNSSGKTNLLEAIDYLFREFDPAFERSIGPLNPELWFGRETTAPIEWNVTLKCDQSELSIIFGKEFAPIFDGIKEKDQIRILRQINPTPQDMRWQTSELALGHVELVKDGKAVPPEEISKVLTPTRLDLVKEMPTSSTTVPATLVQNILTNLSGLLRAQFKYINSARDNVQPSPSFGNRSAIINPTTLSSINTLAQGTIAEIRNKWKPLREKMEITLPNKDRVDSKGGQLFLDNEPLTATGGGAQSILGLIHDIETAPSIVGVEEPENHLHPELIKKMLRYFRGVTNGANAKQLFVATHSPFFVDSSYIMGVIALYWDGKETEVRQIGTKDDLRSAIFDIGARPSDIFFADLVLIVEGESDKIILQGWARTLGIPLEDIHASVIPAKGVNKTRYHLKLWAEVAKQIGLPRYIFVDKDGESEVNKAVSGGLISLENTHILEKGSIEDYYNIGILINALQTAFGVTISKEEIPNEARANSLTKIIKKEPQEWKVQLAEEVCNKTEKRQIPREIGDFLRRVYNENIR